MSYNKLAVKSKDYICLFNEHFKMYSNKYKTTYFYAMEFWAYIVGKFFYLII